LMAVGCTKPKAKLSISEEKMVNLLADAHLVEATLQSNSATLKDSLTKLYYEQLFEIHEVSEADFRSNLKVIEQDAQMMADIYAKVMDELSKREAEHK